MKKIIHIAVLALLLASCANHANLKLENFTLDGYKPRYAQGFSIYSAEGVESTIIAVRNPWQGAKGVEMLTFVERNGQKAPRNFPGQIIKAPAQRIVCLSSSYIAMLDAVDCTDKIVGVSGIDYITNDKILKQAVVDVGHDTNIDLEKLVALRADLVLIFALNNENTALNSKLKELNIPYMYVSDYLEQSPLGKAEWMVALSEIVDKRLDAQKIFLDIEYRYNTLKLSAMSNTNKPLVMLNAPYRDIWFMPSRQSYIAQLISDAGGNYVYSKTQGSQSMPISLEQAYLLCSQSDIWLNTGWHNTLEELLSENPKLKTTKLVKQGRIFNNNARQSRGGGSDFWESGVVAPDRVLEDLINIFSNNNQELYYYKELK